ncbi:hypothetical protein BDV95DRAFT_607093 [Massariosphaeria phaeospora]|uniref:NAD(P)-binding domain-containing protein n=1 Tax=Massariosphaeria phaeospora TaxID=100035 RepID=A0A7C8MAB7_9PLEO|nr:hypothetical protein BDV95DRAFT_607093 [Massariosphaeria phaeospora]
MSSTELKNIILAGATGSIGAPILTALLAQPSFNTTILSRTNSTATFPAHVPVTRVSPAFTVAELTAAFTGQDAVIVALSAVPVTQDASEAGLQYRLIDAAVAAGVKRFIPSEFGANNLDVRARSVVPVYDSKGCMLEYLTRKAEASGGKFTFTSISCGSWIDWALSAPQSSNFLSIDVAARRATIYDSGTSRFSATLLPHTGLAVARALSPLHCAATANTQIFLSDFVASARSIVAALEKASGDTFAVEQRDSAPVLAALRQRFDQGDKAAGFELLVCSFAADVDLGYDFEGRYEIWNARLGLPTVTLDEVARQAVEVADRGASART